MTTSRFSWTALLAAGIVFSGMLQHVQAVPWVGTTDDINDPNNWDGGLLPTTGTPPAGQAAFTDTGSHTPTLTDNFASQQMVWHDDLTSPYSVTGSHILTVGSPTVRGVMWTAADEDVTINVAEINFTRNALIISGDYITGDDNRGTGNLIFGESGGSMVFKFTSPGGNINVTPTITANNGTSIIVHPTIDFSSSTTTSGTNANKEFRLEPKAGSTIELLGGISGTGNDKPSRLVRTLGETGGKTILGDSTNWEGIMRITDSDLEIYHNDSLGTGGYTEMEAGDATGALRLTNNITTGEELYVYERTTTDYPQIRNISGHNTLTNTIASDRPNVSGYHVISSDGTADGDLITIQGDLLRTSGAGNGGGVLVLTGAGDGEVFGSITQSGNNNRWDEVQKNGDGTWKLFGNNDYSGDTKVNAGKLFVNGTNSGGGDFYIAGGATLGGDGTIGANVIVDGILSPGNSPGTLSITGDVTLNGVLLAEVENPLADLLDVTGSVTLGGSSVLDLPLSNTYDANTTYNLITASGGVFGTFSAWTNPIPGTHTLEYFTNSVSLVPIPEPSAFILIGIGTTLAGCRVRRKKRA